ncbi:hypothetical protein Pla144_08210 [Bythopirellula polymerisocia]|uniref:DUF3160 domain-containing protein n=1 Tax=Bythopirellula polymerisocia TaxID=2528003 RepID=A0A5C6D1G5_9BACT|nr:hypothetical protein Pla144_08210 [Bythopirellula polymerisocia]
MRFPFLLLGYFLLFTATLFAQSKDSEPLGAQSLEELIAQEYERILESYQDLTFEQLQERLELIASGDNPLSFDPGEAKYYDVIRQGLKMTEEEQTRFKDNGLVVVDPLQRHSFGSAYYQIYASDLPVLVTTDSVLHAWHRSYDNLLQRIEYSFLMPTIADLLKDCHEQLATQVQDGKEITASYQDVDLYLTVARNLLAGAVSQEWGVKLVVPTKFEQDGEALSRLEDIDSLRLQVQTEPYFTEIYGGKRYVDYSQFQPRGHYSESAPLGSQLSHYFRCMMWLGRADCGFNVLPVDPVAGIEVDWRRELLDAALLSELVRDSGNVERLNSICRFIELLTGESDNLTVSQMLALLESEKNTTADTLLGEDGRQLEQFAAALEGSGQARQRIRSQSIVSNPNDTHKVLPPSLFQVFGQTFAVDSMLLSHSVFDSIIFKGEKQERMMPTS